MSIAKGKAGSGIKLEPAFVTAALHERIYGGS